MGKEGNDGKMMEEDVDRGTSKKRSRNVPL